MDEEVLEAKIDTQEDYLQEEEISVATQWQLMWWKFKKHKMAMASTVVLAIIYLLAMFCEFFSPQDPRITRAAYLFAPPQGIHFFHEGRFRIRPFVYGYSGERDPETMRMRYTVDKDRIYPLKLFIKGDPYKFLGLFEASVHFLGVEEGDIFLLGTDRMGRDMLSRILYGARISTTIGLVGVTVSLILGIILGGISGYFGGIVDNLIQRLIEFMRSIPTIPLWMGLAAALPAHWAPIKVFFFISLILSIVGWTGLARVVRSKFLSIREEDYVLAARLCGAKKRRIILKHMLPTFYSYIIATVTLRIPGMILGETSLSFLGLGMRPPAISWGIILQDAMNIQAVAICPWLLIPFLFVIVTVLAFNFVGDGLRDAADPYAR
jgi:peptide/nickel transport system permease protein